MLVVIWATLLFSVRGSDADPDESNLRRSDCRMGFCVTLSEAEIPAEAGLCVVIPCSFTTDYGFKPKNMIWYKCEPDKQRCGDSDMIFHTSKKVQSGFNGRVSLLDPDLDQGNCSIIICDLVDSDSGSYQFGVGRFPFGKPKITFSPRTTVSVKGHVQHCGPHSAVLLWAVAGVSLSINVAFTIYMICKNEERKSSRQNLHVTAENRQITRV
ncbi:uncharacterized protein LOC115568148 isoform X2 [Sparus aurata]|uniref:uncharacterized protein LOC115568148 isoform X2 n=1 Tax=Sparus aurata TaxID=8175 RepID=UPI0011C0FF11|nr:uncharacterized protein LOC115568148 isoform X2 [Sparus aurata]